MIYILKLVMSRMIITVRMHALDAKGRVRIFPRPAHRSHLSYRLGFARGHGRVALGVSSIQLHVGRRETRKGLKFFKHLKIGLYKSDIKVILVFCNDHTNHYIQYIYIYIFEIIHKLHKNDIQYSRLLTEEPPL